MFNSNSLLWHRVHRSCAPSDSQHGLKYSEMLLQNGWSTLQFNKSPWERQASPTLTPFCRAAPWFWSWVCSCLCTSVNEFVKEQPNGSVWTPRDVSLLNLFGFSTRIPLVAGLKYTISWKAFDWRTVKGIFLFVGNIHTWLVINVLSFCPGFIFPTGYFTELSSLTGHQGALVPFLEWD